ncbi:hypothetical protein TIFTF001_023369 [Ficus carica]|uniref:Uncharacterized protein n=1 Tax=Ficus carica TaxID=3494 RepID=A0AA88AKC1_FICCA|nr:hypothetical protein TIFTF001_023369 [Ficus carica]
MFRPSTFATTTAIVGDGDLHFSDFGGDGIGRILIGSFSTKSKCNELPTVYDPTRH